MSDSNDPLDIDRAATFLQVGETSLWRWTNSGKLTCLRIGLKRELRFRQPDLMAFMEIQPGQTRVAATPAQRPARRKVRSLVLVGTLAGHLCGLYSRCPCLRQRP